MGASSDENEKKSSVEDDDDVEWERLQQKLNKREKLEGKSRISHSVHSPYFPEDKQEYWWTYICDRKSRTLLTAPYHITNLVDREEVQLKFTAPRWPGVYTLTVCLRSGNVPKILTESDKVQGVDKHSCTLTSKTFTINQLFFFLSSFSPDSYIGMDQQQELKLDVQKAPEITTDHPQWDISESESEHNDQQENESEFATDTSEDEE